jgi:D-alanine-D-alanine ligase
MASSRRPASASLDRAHDMRVLILHQEVPEGASADERDVLVQAEAVKAALVRLGHLVRAESCGLDLETLKRRLNSDRPDRVFNLVESLGGTDALQFVVPALLESLGLRFTGSGTAAIFSSGRKTQAKEQMLLQGLPTPPWCTSIGTVNGEPFSPGRYIVKPTMEHASLGMVDADVIEADNLPSLQAAIEKKTRKLGRDCFAERYIEGREFNLSLLDSPVGPEVLPPAEIRFVDYPPGKPRIVGSAAKWRDDSFEYHATVRSFEFTSEDASLLSRLSSLATRCWDVMQLSGYARVDFRVDNSGEPWILEANANPCLTPDAGFAAAATRAGLSFDAVVQRILAAT